MEVKNGKFYSFCRYALCFVLFFILNKASINGIINPFTFGAYFALVWCNQNILILSPLYVVASFLAEFSLFSLYSALFMCVFMCVVYGIHYKLKKRIKPTYMIVYACLGRLCDIFLQIYSGTQIWLVFVQLTLGLLYMVCVIRIFESVAVRGLNKQFTLLQVVCGSVFLLGVSCGVTSLSVAGFSIIKLVLCFVVICSTLTLPVAESLLLTSVISVGTCLFNNNPYLVAPCLIWWLVANCFRGKHKCFVVLGVLVCELMCVFHFNLYYTIALTEMLPCVVSGAIVLCIPSAFYKQVANVYNSSFASRGLQTIINRNQNSVRRRLNELSLVFSQMDTMFKTMISGSSNQTDLKALLVSEIKNKLCKDCQNKNNCHKINSNHTNQVLCDLTDIALSRGRITLIDLPSTLTTKCTRVNQLVYTINDLMEQYKNYLGLITSVDASKILLSEQFYGISMVLKELSNQVGKTVELNGELQKEIIDELTYNDIVCCDAVVYHDNADTVSVTLEVKKEDSAKSKIAQIVSRVCKTKMIVETDHFSEHSGWQILNLKVAPKFDIIFGTSAITKTSSRSSGDCYSIIRMQDGKILMALCDGMGSGERAKQSSETAISLVENFYKAGFSGDVILSIVNKFLTIGNTDVFSCLDLAVVDLNCGLCDLVKLGATNGFVKHKDTTNIIECSSLPLGIISQLTPTTQSTMLGYGDMLILCTDGVNDSFASDEDLADYINNLKTLNPQEVADAILDKSLKNNNGIALDDMTILVCKLF